MDATNQALLSSGTKIISEILESRLNAINKGNKPDIINGKAHDFFDITYTFSNVKDSRHIIRIQMDFPLMNTLNAIIQNPLKKYYGNSIKFENKETATLEYDLTPPVSDDVIADIKKAQFLKRTCIFGLVSDYIDACASSQKRENLSLPLGRKDTLYLQAKDKVFWAIFSIHSDDPAYFLFLRQFAQEFKNIQKYNRMAPMLSYSERDPPKELQPFKVSANNSTFFITLMAEERHFTEKGRSMIADMLTIMPMQIYYTVSNYNMFFISRLRDQSIMLMKRINRCKYVKPVEKKTASGRTFTAT